MKSLLTSILVALACIQGFTTTWTITSPGFTFSPATLTIQEGDSVMFTIDLIHAVREVSQVTWENSGTTQLPGGFNLPSGSGLLVPAQLAVGTHYYVCVPHAAMGMKGIIIVEQTTTSTKPVLQPSSLSISPNPGNGIFQLKLAEIAVREPLQLQVFDLTGREVFRLKDINTAEPLIDISAFDKGTYILLIRNKDLRFTEKLIVQ